MIPPRIGVTYHSAPNPRPVPPVSPVNYNEGAVKFPRGITMPNFDNALQQLREERSRAQVEVDKYDQVISMIESFDGTGVSQNANQPKRIISAASRRKMARAQKARWAKVKAGNVIPIAPKRAKRTISAAGRKRIAAAARARWKKFRAAKKK